MSAKSQTQGEWLTAWDPEDEKSWDKALAWRTLWITTFSLTLCFVAWFLPSAIVPKLNALGYDFTKSQLYWLAAMPGLAGGLMRLIWMVLPPIVGTRKMVAFTSLLLIAPTLGWGVRVQSPTAPYWELLVLAFLAGIGGGAFSGFMPSRAPRSGCRRASATSVSRSCSWPRPGLSVSRWSASSASAKR